MAVKTPRGRTGQGSVETLALSFDTRAKMVVVHHMGVPAVHLLSGDVEVQVRGTRLSRNIGFM